MARSLTVTCDLCGDESARGLSRYLTETSWGETRTVLSDEGYIGTEVITALDLCDTCTATITALLRPNREVSVDPTQYFSTTPMSISVDGESAELQRLRRVCDRLDDMYGAARDRLTTAMEMHSR